MSKGKGVAQQASTLRAFFLGFGAVPAPPESLVAIPLFVSLSHNRGLGARLTGPVFRDALSAIGLFSTATADLTEDMMRFTRFSTPRSNRNCSRDGSSVKHSAS